ncbi:MAG TPA: DUF4870 domain-containing protein [Streptosporangiaceae bacterium]|nr:DUF4870 domain-containing protein [Streptosporangiaceae bacterium]
MTSRPMQPPAPTGPGPAGFMASDGGAQPAGHPAGAPSAPAPASRPEVHRAMLAYLGVPFTLVLVPLVIYLASLHGRPFARWHAAQAVNVAATAIVYTLCGLILGAVLALDSVQVATLIAVPLLAVLWICVLVVLVRAAGAASRGERQPVPRWLRVSR